MEHSAYGTLCVLQFVVASLLLPAMLAHASTPISEQGALRAELAALREESEAIRRRIAEIESRLPERPHRRLGVEDVIVLRLTNSEAEQLCRGLSLNWPEHLNVEFRISAKVVDVSPEDDLVIFGRRTIRIDEVLYQQNVSGTVERERLDQQRQIDASEVRDLSIDTSRLK